jgi:hypothetical protein
MADSPTSGDMFLARRFNFVGLPSERRSGAVSYPALRAELGDDNAAALVTKIGVLATVHGLDKLGVPLHHAVDRILQSLTPDERRTMAQGGAVPPRVEAMISAEAAAAKQQQQTGANATGANAPSAAAESFFLKNSMRMLARDADDRQTSSNAYARGLNGGIDTAAMRALGLSDATGKALAAMGFRSAEEVKALVHDAGSLGLDKNKGSVALGMIKSDDPQNYEGHRHFFEHSYRPGLENIEGMNGQIAAEKDPAKKAELIKKRDQAKAELEAKRQEQRKKSNGHTRAQQGFDDVSRQMQNNAKHRLQLGPQAAREMSSEQMRAQLSPAVVAKAEAAEQADRSKSEKRTSIARAADVDDVWGDDPKPDTPEKRTNSSPAIRSAEARTPSQDAAHSPEMQARAKTEASAQPKPTGDAKSVKVADAASAKARPVKAPTPT